MFFVYTNERSRLIVHFQHVLLAQAAQESQRKGKSGQLVDPRPQTVDGEIKIVITPQLKLDIFEEYPVVKKAFDENVDKKVRVSTLQLCSFLQHYPYVVIRARVLAPLFPVEAIQRTSSLYSFFCSTTCGEG